jgi:hypothetical protein
MEWRLGILVVKPLGPPKFFLGYFPSSLVDTELPFIVDDLTGKPVIKDIFKLQRGKNSIELPVQKLPPGIYQLFSTGRQPLSLCFVKH